MDSPARRIRSLAAVLCSFAGLQCCGADAPCATNAPWAGLGSMRTEMLQRFRSHFDDYDKGMFEKKHKRPYGNQTIMLSKKDSMCSGRPLPTYYIEFTVEGARPVDVFNVMSDTMSQPNWLCKGCTIKLLKNDLQDMVQGFAATYRAVPLGRREFYQWQAVDADFNSNEFLIGVSSKHNQMLHRLQPVEPDATVGRLCYSFSRIRPHPKGTHVMQMTHFDARVPPLLSMGFLSPRNMYHIVWPMMLQRVPQIIDRAKEQAKKNWDARRLAIPSGFVNGFGAVAAKLYDADVPMPRVSSSVAQSDGYDELDPDMKARLPWIMTALVLVGMCGLSLLCGLLVFCGACARCGFPKQGGSNVLPSFWQPLDPELQLEEDSDE